MNVLFIYLFIYIYVLGIVLFLS